MTEPPYSRISPAASEDLDQIWRYIAADSSAETASAVVERILKSAQLAAAFPQMGTSRDEIREGWRSTREGQYYLFYREVEGGIELMRVIHVRRDLARALRDFTN